jgi:hypothetical protein
LQGRFIADKFIAGSIHRRSIHRRIDASQDRFIVISIHCRVDSSQGRFIAGSIYRRSIHRRVMSTENLIETCNFLAGHKKPGSFCCKNFLIATTRYWKASSTEIYLIEMCYFWSEHENWVHLVVKSYLAFEKNDFHNLFYFFFFLLLHRYVKKMRRVKWQKIGNLLLWSSIDCALSFSHCSQ